MKLQQALHTLAKFFSMDSTKFLELPESTIIQWASEIGPKYQLTHAQHNWLIGMGYN